MAIAGESVTGRVLEFRQQTPDKFVPTVPLAEATTPELVVANQEKTRDAYWQVMYLQTMERIKRDLEFALNTQEPGSISHEAVKSELFVEKGCFWFPYLTPEQRKKIEAGVGAVTLTGRERAEGLTLEEKRKQRLERKAFMLNRERKIDWQRGLDKSIWKRLNNRFFLESKGVTYADIDEELSKGFLETFDREEEMYNFLLGVGWNQKLVDIFNNRSRPVEELREILSQRMFKIKDDGTIVRFERLETDEELKRNNEKRAHFDDLKKDEDKINEVKYILGWGDADSNVRYGDTRELMRTVRIVQGAEEAGGRQQKAKGLINEYLIAEGTKLDTLNGFNTEQQRQLNNRAQVLFGDDFLNLTNEEQLMTTTGPGTILSLEEIMDFLSDYEAPIPYNKTDATKIRPESVDREYAYWIRYGWVSMIGPWRLADRINKIIFSYSARDDQRMLQRQQIESAGMSGFGKYTYFDWDYYEAFHGAGGEGKRKTLLEGTINKVEWPKGFWADYQKSQNLSYTKYVEEAKKIGGSKRILSFEEFCYGMIGVRGYQKIAQEWFLSGWRLVAEGVYLKLRGEMVERAAKWGGKAEQIKEALEQDIMQQKITHAGEKVLEERFNKSRKGLFLDIVELFKCWTDKEGHKFTRFGNALVDLFARQLGLNFLLKDMNILGTGIKSTPAGLFNLLYVLPRFLTTWLSTKPVTILAFEIERLGWKFAGFHLATGGWVAAWPYALIFGTLLGGISLLRDRLIFLKDVGEKKWAKIEEKNNERFKALAENPTRAMIESGWDPKKASVDTHEPIKII